MFIRYLLSRKSWVLLFVLQLVIMDVLILFDQGIQIEPVSLLYINGLFLIMFVLFFLWRYKKETRYTAALASIKEFMSSDWAENLPEPGNDLDSAVSDVMREAFFQFKRKLSEQKEAQLIENDFIASWIHEVKTPLTAMKLIMDSRRSDPDIRKLKTEWLRIHLLVDQQLYMSRLPVLESDYVLEQAPLHRLVAEEVRELAPWCTEKNIAVSMEGPEADVITDRKWCRFIVRQLLTNAVKYSPPDTTIILVTSRTDAGHVILDIQDQGPGIQAHDLPRIFDKGFTGENGRIQNAATGLGLYLAQTVASKIGVGLKVKSTDSHGTTMRMVFAKPDPFEMLQSAPF